MKRLLFVSFLAVVFLPSCENGMVKVGGQPLGISISPSSTQTIAQGQTIMYTATVTNDVNNKGVMWTATCTGEAGCGSFSQTMTASGVATTYTAPPEGSANAAIVVTVTATAVADTTKSAPDTVNVNPPSVTITTACGTASTSPCAATDGTTNITATATVSNDISNMGVAWSATCSDARTPCGSFSSTTTLSGTPTTYTAPSIITPVIAKRPATLPGHTKPSSTAASSITVTITATPVLSSIGFAFATTPAITINALPTCGSPVVCSSVMAPPGTVGMPYSFDLSTLITGGTPPFIWTVDASSPTTLPHDNLSLTGSVVSGTPQNPALPQRESAATSNADPFTVIFDVTDADGQKASLSVTFTINAAAAACTGTSASLPCGQFAIFLQGFNSGGPIAMAGSLNFPATNTAPCATSSPCLLGAPSVMDLNLNATGITGTSGSTVTGSFTVDANNIITLTLNIGASGNVAATTLTFAFALNSAGNNGEIMEFDTSGNQESGFIQLQDTTVFTATALNGNSYALGFVGYNSNTGTSTGLEGARVGIVGVAAAYSGCFNATSAAGFGLVVNNDGGIVSGSATSPLGFTGACGGIDSTTGRGTITFNLGTASPFGSSFLSFTFYIVSNNGSGMVDKLYFVQTDAIATNVPILGGRADIQTKSSFSTSDVNCGLVMSVDVGCLVEQTAITLINGAPGNARVELDLATQPSPGGSLTVTSQIHKRNNPFTPGTPTMGYTFTVTSTGFVTVSAPAPPAGDGGMVVIALDDPDDGQFLDLRSDVGFGRLVAQTTTSLGATIFVTGSKLTDDLNVPNGVGFLTFASAGTISGNLAGSGTLTGLVTDTAVTGAFGPIDPTTGFGQGTSMAPGPLSFAFYVRNGGQIILIETDSVNTDPVLVEFLNF